MIPLLKNLGFLDQANNPTLTYAFLKGEDRKVTLAEGIRLAYEPLFKANESAWKLQGDPLKRLIAQVGGTDDDITSRIAAAFSSLVKVADFNSSPKSLEPKPLKEEDSGDDEESGRDERARPRTKGLRQNFST